LDVLTKLALGGDHLADGGAAAGGLKGESASEGQ